MFAGAERVFPKIRAGAVGFAALPPAQSDAISFAGNEAGDGVVGPERLRIHGLHFHLFGGCSFFAVGDGPGGQFFGGKLLGRLTFRRACRQVEGQLFLQNDGQRRPRMLARLGAGTAAQLETRCGMLGSLDGNEGFLDIEQKELIGQGNIQIEIDCIAAARSDQILALGAEQGGGALHGELGQRLFELTHGFTSPIFVINQRPLFS